MVVELGVCSSLFFVLGNVRLNPSFDDGDKYSSLAASCIYAVSNRHSRSWLDVDLSRSMVCWLSGHKLTAECANLYRLDLRCLSRLSYIHSR